MKNVMNLTPEEKFNQAIWWILKEIKIRFEPLKMVKKNRLWAKSMLKVRCSSPLYSSLEPLLKSIEVIGNSRS